MKKLIGLIVSGGIALLCISRSYALESNQQLKDVKNLGETNISDYAKDRIIVKLKSGKTLEDIRTLNEKYKVISASKLFEKQPNPRDVLNSLKDKLAGLDVTHQSWYWQLDKDSQEYKDYLSKIEKEKEDLRNKIKTQEEFIGKLEQRQKRAPEGITAPNLDNIYVLKISQDIDIPFMVGEYNVNSAVEYAQPDHIMSTQMIPNDLYYSSTGSWGQEYDDLWGLKKIEAEKAWDISQGENIIVSVIDTGVDYTHPDISENIWHKTDEIPLNGIDDDNNGYIDDYMGFDFANSKDTNGDGDYIDTEDVNDSDPVDDNGHGTHVAGTIAATGNNNIGIIGVAPQAKIMPVKCLNSSGSGSESALAQGIVYSVYNNADVINNSWGCDFRCPDMPLVEDVVRQAVSLGVIVVFAAGNKNDDVAYYSPQNMWETITVAASTEIDAKAVFSNYGCRIDISAPGAGENVSSPFYQRNILSLRAASTGDEDLIVDNQYLRHAGTSMAAPHVSGAAALILAHQPSLTTEQVKQALRKGSDDILTAGWDKYSGYGRLSLHKALQIDQPLEVVITSPKQQDFSGVKNIEIKGTVKGAELIDWTLEYGKGENPVQWVPIASSTSPVVNDVLAVWDVSDFIIEELVLRLRANSKNGIFEDRRCCIITNAYITSPMHTDIINPYQPVDIIGTIAGKVTNYTVEYGQGLSPTEWFSKGVTLSGLDHEAIYDNVIATIVPNSLPAEGFYTLRLRMYNNEESKDLFVKMIFADFKLKKGWPVHLPKESLSVGDVQPFAVEDINNDGFKEIVTIRDSGSDPFKHPKENHPTTYTLEVYDYQGRLIWTVLLSTGFPIYDHAPAIADIDRDGYKEIIVNGYFSINVFRYDGTLMDGWPIITGLGLYRPVKIVADVDCDGNQEIIAWSHSGERLYIFSKEGNVKLELLLPSGNQSAYDNSSMPAIGNLDEDNKLEIIIAQIQSDGSNKIFAVNPDGTNVSGWPISLESGEIPNIVTGDINNDGKDEVVIKIENSIYVFKGNGALLSGWPIIAEKDFFGGSGVALADFDGDEDLEIVWAKNGYSSDYTSKALTMHVVHHTGIYVQGWPQTVTVADLLNDNALVRPTIGDVNGDGKADIVIASGGLTKNLLTDGDFTKCEGVWAWNFDGSLIPLNDLTGVYPRFTQQPGSGSYYTPVAPVVITDVDNNGMVDLVASNTCTQTWDPEDNFSWIFKGRGELYIWELGASFNAGQNFWPAGQHDFCNTGRYSKGEINHRPIFLPIGNKSIDEGKLLEFIVSASDADGDELTYSVRDLPTGATFIGQNFRWTPTYDQSGVYNMLFIVEDNKNGINIEAITVTVNNINRPPILDKVEDKEIEAGKLLSFVVSASDPDGDKVFIKGAKMADGSAISTIGAELVCNPEGITRFNWTPTNKQAGKSYFVCFQAADDKGAVSGPLTVKIDVKKINTPPQLFFMFCAQEQEVEVGQLVEFIVVGDDGDDDVFRITATIPEDIIDATFVQRPNALAGLFRWRPTNAHAGKSYYISFDAVDCQDAKSNTLIAKINVQPVNNPPVFTAIPAEDYQAQANQNLNFPVSVYDPDGDTVSLSANVNILGVSFPLDSIGAKFIGSSDGFNGYNTKTFIWTPEVKHSRIKNYRVVFTAKDSRGATISKTVTFNVLMPPIILKPGWNFVALANLSDPSYTAAKLMKDINSQNGSVPKIMSWDGSGWRTYNGVGDFKIEIGKGYFVWAKKKSTFSITGTSPTTITWTLNPGMNMIGVPFEGYTAKSLSQAIISQGGKVTKIQRWDGGGWQTYNVGAPSGDFKISSTEGIVLYASGTSSFQL